MILQQLVSPGLQGGSLDVPEQWGGVAVAPLPPDQCSLAGYNWGWQPMDEPLITIVKD